MRLPRLSRNQTHPQSTNQLYKREHPPSPDSWMPVPRWYPVKLGSSSAVVVHARSSAMVLLTVTLNIT